MWTRCDTERGTRPRVILEDEIGRCLCFLDTEPEAYPRVARQWAARLLDELPLSLDEARLVLGALDQLAKGSSRCCGEELAALLDEHRLSRAARILRAWLDASPAAGPLSSPAAGPLSAP